MDQARALGLDRQLLGQLAAETTLDEQARKLRLGISNAEIARRITADPAFRGASGQFDRFRFEQLIRQGGYTEPRYVAEQRKLALRRHLAEAVTGGLTLPNAELETLNRFQNEERSIDYVTLGEAQAGTIEKPSPEELAKYFEERKPLFRAPEYRQVSLLALTPDEIARWTEVSDADAKRDYDDNRDRYVTPERRQVQQMVFPNAEEAGAASERIGKGLSFADLAAERGLKDSDIDLGLVTKKGVVDSAIANAAFALKEGEVSAPVQGRFGSALLRVQKIEPEVARPFPQIQAEIKRTIAIERARSQVADNYNKIEDERAGGQSLAEVAGKLGLSARTIEAVDRSGRDPEGAPVKGLPEGTDMLAAAFASDVGVENDPVQLDGGYLWYEVGGITRSRERSLDEVKNQVEARWRDDQIAARLKTKAAEMIDKLKGGASFAEAAAADKAKVETASGLKRQQSSAALPPKVLDEAFRAAKDVPTAAEGDQATRRVVFRVTDIKVPKLDANVAETKNMSDAMRRSMVDELLAEYIARLENDIGVTINQAALNQVARGAGPEPE
jgi:peptidyl-prolyl cis-trans isomerase D